MRLSPALVIGCLMAAFSFGVSGQSLGTFGKTWEIAEQDFIEMISQKYAAMEQSGKIDEIRKAQRAKVQSRFERPDAIPGISQASKARSWLYDPTMIVPDPILDHEGNIIVPAGTRVNPLQYRPLTKKVVFFDGDSKEQVAFVEKMLKAEPRTKPVLVSGALGELMRKWGRPVFFDVAARMTKTWGIKHTPAIVKQEGLMLRIDEVEL